MSEDSTMKFLLEWTFASLLQRANLLAGIFVGLVAYAIGWCIEQETPAYYHRSINSEEVALLAGIVTAFFFGLLDTRRRVAFHALCVWTVAVAGMIAIFLFLT